MTSARMARSLLAIATLATTAAPAQAADMAVGEAGVRYHAGSTGKSLCAL